MNDAKEPLRKAELHCHVQEENKRWLQRKANGRNVAMGRVVDDLVSAERLREREERARSGRVVNANR